MDCVPASTNVARRANVWIAPSRGRPAGGARSLGRPSRGAPGSSELTPPSRAVTVRARREWWWRRLTRTGATDPGYRDGGAVGADRECEGVVVRGRQTHVVVGGVPGDRAGGAVEGNRL